MSAAAPSTGDVDGKPVLFLVGSGRSGTTLLYELLCVHPAAAWISNLSQRRPALARLHPARPTAFKGDRRRWTPRPVEGYRLYDRVRPDSSAAPRRDGDRLVAADLSPRERADLRAAVAAHLRPARARFFVNKNTRNTRRVGYLAAAFPEARFVHVVRNPIATVSSLARVAFFRQLHAFWRDGRPVSELIADGEAPELLAAELWTSETRSCRTELDDLDPQRVLVVRYEELVTDPVATLAAAAGLVGETVHPAMLEEIEARGVADRNTAGGGLPAHLVPAVWDIVAGEAARFGYGP